MPTTLQNMRILSLFESVHQVSVSARYISNHSLIPKDRTARQSLALRRHPRLRVQERNARFIPCVTAHIDNRSARQGNAALFLVQRSLVI